MQTTPPNSGRDTPRKPRRQEVSTHVSLIARLCYQDATAWRDFLGLYSPLVVRWCHRQCLPETDIADVAQEVFLKVSRGIHNFHKETAADSFRGWLCRITHNEIVNHRRRAPAVQPAGGSTVRRQIEAVAAPLPTEPSADEVQQETHFLYSRAIELVRSEFSDFAWKMFWRVAVDGNPAVAVAREFATTPGAVRQNKLRILRRLKQIVGDVPE
jgi:RNA polymerase sigma-70 factor (ECF subfamily)